MSDDRGSGMLVPLWFCSWKHLAAFVAQYDPETGTLGSPSA